MKSHWLSKVIDILTSEEANLKRLAALVGADPKTFYRGADLSRADLSGQDLRGMDFTGAILRGAIFDDQTYIDPKFDPIEYDAPVVKHVRLSGPLMDAVHAFRHEVGYVYTGSALKSLIESASRQFYYRSRTPWLELIEMNPTFSAAVSSAGDNTFYYRINLKTRYFLFVRHLQRYFGTHHNAYAAAVLIGLLARKMRGKKDYRDVPLGSIYPNSPTS